MEIQKGYNSSLQHKLSNNIDQLINYQKSMKINYLIIKKLEIDNLELNDADLRQILFTFIIKIY